MSDDYKEQQLWLTLETMIKKGNVGVVDAYLESLTPAETARTISRLKSAYQKKLFELLGPDEAADVLLDLPDEQIADLIEGIDSEQAAAIVSEMPGEDVADILADVHEDNVEAILDEMPREKATKARQLLKYSKDSAGGIMSTEFLSYDENKTIDEVLSDLREHREVYLDYNIQYAYVVSSQGSLKGVLRMRDLLLLSAGTRISDVMIKEPFFVNGYTPLEKMIELFEEHTFLGIPVVDKNQKMLGVVRRSQVLEAEGERDRDSYLKASGIVGGEELRSMPWWERSQKRLSWLSINILLNVLAASVIAFYQDTLSAVIALAVFLPIISDMSGCSGNQAVAVSIRELTLGLVKPYELWRVLLKEMSVGIINGIILGLLLGIVAFIWKGNMFLGLVVGGALALNTIVAVCLGGMVPLILKWMKKDPALASGPILTTVTDMCGFLFTLGFATLCLAQISM